MNSDEEFNLFSEDNIRIDIIEEDILHIKENINSIKHELSSYKNTIYTLKDELLSYKNTIYVLLGLNLIALFFKKNES